jgi:hypothetical protein
MSSLPAGATLQPCDDETPAAEHAMSRIVYLTLAAASVLSAGCVVAPYPAAYPAAYPATVSTPPNSDRSWDAALGAAADAGVQVTSADRAAGRITGIKGGANVTIELRQQADNTLRVSFNAPDAKETNPTLGERMAAAYNRRMGR